MAWKLLKNWPSKQNSTYPGGLVKIAFTTIDGQPAQCDSLMLNGPIFGFFGASKEAKGRYEEMTSSYTR